MGITGSMRSTRLAMCFLMLGLSAISAFGQKLYQPPQIITNDFALYARLRFTNYWGRVFPPGSAVHLSDLTGYVVFMEFFDPT
jgi:hypothetical protein